MGLSCKLSRESQSIDKKKSFCPLPEGFTDSHTIFGLWLRMCRASTILVSPAPWNLQDPPEPLHPPWFLEFVCWGMGLLYGLSTVYSRPCIFLFNPFYVPLCSHVNTPICIPMLPSVLVPSCCTACFSCSTPSTEGQQDGNTEG